MRESRRKIKAAQRAPSAGRPRTATGTAKAISKAVIRQHLGQAVILTYPGPKANGDITLLLKAQINGTLFKTGGGGGKGSDVWSLFRAQLSIRSSTTRRTRSVMGSSAVKLQTHKNYPFTRATHETDWITTDGQSTYKGVGSG